MLNLKSLPLELAYKASYVSQNGCILLRAKDFGVQWPFSSQNLNMYRFNTNILNQSFFKNTFISRE